MKHKLVNFIVFSLLFSLFLPLICQAIIIDNPLKKAESFIDLVDIITNFIFWVGIAIGPLMIIIGGFYFLTAAGSEEKIRTAKNIILYTVIGLAIILLAKGLVSVIKSALGG